MKLRHCTTILLLAIFIQFASGQIIIDKVIHPANPGITERGVNLLPGSISAPAQGVNKTWDYSGALAKGDSIEPRIYLQTTDTISHPGSNRYYTQSVSFSGLIFDINFYESNNNNSNSQTGFDLRRQAFDLSGATGTSGDSLVFIKQNHLYNTPHTIIKYPATYKSAWSYVDRVVTDFRLTAHAFFGLINYNNAPGQRVQNIIYRDSVAGYGRMNVPFGTDSSAGYPVIMVKYFEKINDSLYLNNKPAPQAVLAATNTKNGKDTFLYGFRFYRPYFSAPLMTIETDSTYSTKILGAFYDPDHLAKTGIAQQNNTIPNISGYPNPSTDGNFNLNLDNCSAGTYKITVLNMLGEEVTRSGFISTGSPLEKINIQIPANCSNGIYLFTVVGQNVEKPFTGKISLNR